MKFKRSACIETLYTELPFLERFQAAKEDGFDAVSFWSWTDKDLDQICEVLRRTDIRISGFNGGADYSMIDPEQKEEYLAFLRQSAAAAQKVGAESLILHSNALEMSGFVLHDYPELSDAVKLCTMFDTLKECAKIAEESGIMMCLEPLNVTTDHVGSFLTSTRTAAELCELIGSPKLKILYNVYHMQLNEGNLCDNIGVYASQIGCVNFADVPGHHEPGTGEINFHTILTLLEQVGYQGSIGYELYPESSTAKAVRAIMALR